MKIKGNRDLHTAVCFATISLYVVNLLTFLFCFTLGIPHVTFDSLPSSQDDLETKSESLRIVVMQNIQNQSIQSIFMCVLYVFFL